MVNRKIIRILYIGAGLDVKNILDYVNKNINVLNDNFVCKQREYICVDSLPRSPNQTLQSISYKNYVNNFTDNLIKICEERGFELKEAIQLDDTYRQNTLSLTKKCYYSFCGHIIPTHINPELWIFTNYKTNETIRYYISTNVDVNQHELLVRDIRNSNILYINKYIPSCVLFELYNRKQRKIVATCDTNFQVNKTNKDSILKVLNYNINFFNKYILLMPDKYRIYNDFNDFKDKVIKYNKNLNNIV